MTMVPLLAALLWLVLFVAWFVVRNKYGHAPIEDCGIIWLVCLCLYCTFPPLAWWYYAGDPTLFSSRLRDLSPTTDDIVLLQTMALAYAVPFALTYSVLIPRRSDKFQATYAYIDNPKLIAAGLVFVLASGVSLGLQYSGLIRAADSYGDMYLAISELTTGVRQVLKFSEALAFFASLVLVLGVFQRWPKYRWPIVIYVLVLIASYDPAGARVKLVLGIAAVAWSWHIVVRPLSTPVVVLTATIGLFGFNLLGAARGASETGSAVVMRAGVGEFESVWENALHVLQQKQANDFSVPPLVTASEFYAFVPSQLLWFEKTDLLTWYVDTYFRSYRDAGGGYAFGALTQAIAGGGYQEAIIRAVALAIVLAFLTRAIRRTSAAWWWPPVLLFLLTSIYQSVRATVFAQIVVIQTLLIGLVAVQVAATIVQHFGRFATPRLPFGAVRRLPDSVSSASTHSRRTW